MKVNNKVKIESLSKNKKIILFGTGSNATRVLLPLLSSGVTVDYFCDNNQAKKGTYISQIKCLSFSELTSIQKELLVIITVEHYEEIKKQLKDSGYNNVYHYSELNLWDNFIDNIELDLVEHCDLNCKNCSHFSNISPESIIPLNTIKNDLYKLSTLAETKLHNLKIMGGEPLLHPDLIEIMNYSRECFPNSNILLVTNGLKLLSQTKEFWLSCKNNNIEITPTKYPINVDYAKIESIAEEYHVMYRYYNDAKVTKTSYRSALDLNGTQNPKVSCELCFRARNCATLIRGKLYLCPVAATAHIFNEQFNENLIVAENDYILLSSVRTLKEITSFLSKEIPFCRYCDIANTTEGETWGITSKKINEWLL